MKDWKDGIQVGDRFNAIVVKGEYSKTLFGKELAGQVAHGCPCTATRVRDIVIEAVDRLFVRKHFRFEKINTEREVQ